MSSLKALVASADGDWRTLFADTLMGRGCDVHTTSDGMEGVDLIHKHDYDIVVVDETLAQMSHVEFVLNVRDIASKMPVAIVTGKAVEKHAKLWQHCGVFFAGNRPAGARKIEEAVDAALPRAV